MAGYAARKGYETLVSTNGMLVTADFARSARKARLQVQVSLDGSDAETNDAVRGRGTFDRGVRAIRTLVGHGTYTILSMVCHEGNFFDLEKYYDLAMSLGADEARFIPLKTLGAATRNGLRKVPLVKIVKTASSLFHRRPELLKLARRDAFSILSRTCGQSCRRPSCGTGAQTCLLDADGWLYPCANTALPEFRIANIRNETLCFENVWWSSESLQAYRRATAIDGADSGCRNCHVRYWCLGWCRGETYAATGELGAATPNCSDLKQAFVEMFWALTDIRKHRGRH